jgi:hypothetical protein
VPTADDVNLELLAALPGRDGSSATQGQAGGRPAKPTRQALTAAYAKASLNAWVEPTQDVAAATVRRDKLEGAAGVGGANVAVL